MPVQQHILNWLYSVLTSVRTPCAFQLPPCNKTIGIPRCESHLQRRRPSSWSISYPRSQDRRAQYGPLLHVDARHHQAILRLTQPSSLLEWRKCSPAAPLGHHTGQLPRQHLQVPDIDMGSTCLPARASPDLRHADRIHDGPSGAARRPSRPGLPPLPGRMGRILGCKAPPRDAYATRD